jgi:flagellum-specific peptidoglycan hydrolase FlgJ
MADNNAVGNSLSCNVNKIDFKPPGAMQKQGNLVLVELCKGAHGPQPVKGRDLSKTSKSEFVSLVYEWALKEQLKHGYPASVTTAQAILESGYGKQIPTDRKTDQYSFNLFGIKGSGPAGSVYCGTQEENSDGKRIKIKDYFRAYYSFEQSVEGSVLVNPTRTL